MPTYTYECERCSARTEEQRPIVKRHDPLVCPKCKAGLATLVITATARLFPGADHWRTRMRSRGEGA